MKENYPEIEDIKCIQIGLLYVQENPNVNRPIVTIITYLDNHSIELPSPQELVFSLNERMDQNIIVQESSFGLNHNNSTPSSVNEMSISEFLCRQ